MANTLRQRLLRDIAEIQTKPYPNIAFRIHDERDLRNACLVLTVEGYGDMHLTVELPHDYPLRPPSICMNSNIAHPNIFGNYICSSILNTTDGYTSAYTLKSICIQLLSFFSSDKVEQTGGKYSVNLVTYKSQHSYIRDTYTCPKCRFGTPNFSTDSFNYGERINLGREASPFEIAPAQDTTNWPTPQESSRHVSTPCSSSSASGPTAPGQGPILGRNARRRKAKQNAEARSQAALLSPPTPADSLDSYMGGMDIIERVEPAQSRTIVDMKLPNEVVLLICDQLDTEDLMAFAQAWARIPRVMNQFDIIRTRELQCFCLKQSYLSVKLGVGVHIESRSLESEFDLLSKEGFYDHNIRRSTQGRKFEHWLPLPISNGHWRKVSDEAPAAIYKLGSAAKIQFPTSAKVLYQFMNDIVVKLNQAAQNNVIAHDAPRVMRHKPTNAIRSSLTHASEKAIESYFHLFHLLVCLATADPGIVRSANRMIEAFVSGRTSKRDCPNLGHLLVAALISEVDISESVIKTIIRETVTRNVVWMLKRNPELAYLEPSAVSEYRLHHTFQASKTSYRLLMFLNLFRKTAVGNPRKPLITLRDEAFERHGAPPRGSAKGLANAIKRIHAVDRFPDFLAMMDIKNMPSREAFNAYLHKCIRESGEKGYSRMAISQGEALFLRQAKEPGVEVAQGVYCSYMDARIMSGRSFFPDARDGRRGGVRGRGVRRG